MTTETTSLQRAMTIIEEQRKLIDTYKNLLAAYDNRQTSMSKYLETIYALLEAGFTSPKHTDDAELGLKHLSGLIERMQKKAQPA